MSAPFSLTILGSAGALPVPGKFPSAQFLLIGNTGFLIDAGEGVQFQLMKQNISHHKIRYVLISHLHGDHYLGLMGLLFSMHLTARKHELHIFSHSGLDEIILTQLKHAGSVLCFPLYFHHLEPEKEGHIIEQDDLTVSTIPLKHRVLCSGFLFREKPGPYRIIKEKLPKDTLIQHIVRLKSGNDILDENGKAILSVKEFTLPPHRQRSYAYCSDTAPSEEVVKITKQVDLMYHEATFSEEDKDRAKETFHSTAAQAAAVAKKAGARKLIIGHLSARYRNTTAILEEAQSIFPETKLAEEGNIFEISL